MKNDIILINKPIDWTSFDVVKKIRVILKKKYNLKKLKVGHAGTLDPLATGLLIVCTGNKTKEISKYQNLKKTYLAKIKLGYITESFDRETAELNQKDYKKVPFKKIKNFTNFFLGEQTQIPPKFSAIKVNGKRAYEKARKNETFKINPRTVIIYSLVIKKIDLPFISFEVECSKGTYIRSLANDIGKHLGCGAYLYDLKRLSIGKQHVDSSFDMESFKIFLDELE